MEGAVKHALSVSLYDNIIARGHNLREKTFDATAHAEIVAIRKACTPIVTRV